MASSPRKRKCCGEEHDISPEKLDKRTLMLENRELVRRTKELEDNLEEGVELVRLSKDEKDKLQKDIDDLKIYYETQVEELRTELDAGTQEAAEDTEMNARLIEAREEIEALETSVICSGDSRENFDAENKILNIANANLQAELEVVLNEKLQAEEKANGLKKRAEEDEKKFAEKILEKNDLLEMKDRELGTVRTLFDELQVKCIQDGKNSSARLEELQRENENLQNELESITNELALETAKLAPSPPPILALPNPEVAQSSRTMEEVLNAETEFCFQMEGKNGKLRKYEEMKGKVKNYKQLVQELKTKLQWMSNKDKRLRAKLTEAETSMQQYKEYFPDKTPAEVLLDYQKLQSEMHLLEGQLTIKTQLIDKISDEKPDDLKAAKDESTAKLKSVEDMDKLKNLNKQLEDRIIVLSQENDRLSAAARDEKVYQSTQLELETKTQQLEDANTNCQKLKGQLDSMENDLSQHKNRLDVLKKEKNESCSELSSVRSQRVSLEESNKELQGELTQIHQRFCERDELLATQRQQMAQVQQQLDTIKVKISNAEKMYDV